MEFLKSIIERASIFVLPHAVRTSFARLWTFNKRTYFNTFQNGSLVRRWLFYTFIEFLNVQKEVKLRKEILPQKNLRVNVSKNQRK